ncbi:MAG TPA: HmuY family protein [Cyclobacteriaceae bacterium]
MNKFFQFSFLIAALSCVVLLSSCSDDPALPDNLANFESDAQGFSVSESQLAVNVALVRGSDADASIVVGFSTTGVNYGTDFTTEPASVNNTITLPVAAGQTSASFKVNRTNTTGLKGDEKIVFTLQSAADGLLLGQQNIFTLSFSEIIASSAAMEINGGGATIPNQVFIDLSANRQTAVARTSWDLAFASAGDQFRVVLNSANKMLARALTKTDLSTVTASDTAGFGAQFSVEAVFAAATSGPPNSAPAWIYQSPSWIDDQTGDLTKTAIEAVSAIATDNKVYIINRGTGVNGAKLGWKKIRVIRNGSNYALQHADINSPNFTTLEVPKNSTTGLTYVSLTGNSVVTVEPATASWDIAWTPLTYVTSFGGAPFAYYYQDMIIQNRTGVSTVEVLTSAISYDNFKEANLASVMLVSTSEINIGAKWRKLSQTGSSINTDRFYIVKDAAGNIYKIMFTALATNGERGKPQFKFDLVKKGA